MMTRTATLFDAKDVQEKDIISFTFAESMVVGESIESVTITAEVFSGVDASPSATLSGAPTVGANAVTQLVQAGVQDTSYLYRCQATMTPTGRIRVSSGILPVIRIAK